jgi:hypothetical protein
MLRAFRKVTPTILRAVCLRRSDGSTFNPAKPSRSLLLRVSMLVFTASILMRAITLVRAQEMGEAGSENGTGMEPMSAPTPNDPNLPAPLPHIQMRQPIEGSMMVSPPYGNAPLTVGFFVLATDPETIGFLTYQWNFGDGTVSALPPELYIFHHYRNPGTYVCSLVVKTVDGRSKTLFQGVVVKPPR